MALEEYKDYFSGEYQTGRLAVAVCNAGINSEELSDMPHEKREDLALFYGIRVPAEKNGAGIAAMEKEGRALGKEADAVQILDNLQKRYYPHRDKGNFNTRIRNMQKAFSETMEVFDTKNLDVKENKELLVKKCMGLTMECIRAHIFVAVDYQEPVMGQAHESQDMISETAAQKERGMTLCSQ